MQKAKPRPKWSFQDAFQRWTLKGVFRFLHSVSVGVPKIFAVFSCFLYELSVLKRVLKALKD
ncbi:hypothetical protein AC624_14770 [Bacillus sp. FJAT-27238]|nr:hypothetical protein AC624_14770 [Bacillus sp. FJAT-27238]